MSPILQFTPGEGRIALMCPPTHFELRYAINPLMKAALARGEKVNKPLAFAQWFPLAFLLQTFGVRLHFIISRRDTPDMVFTANAGLLYENQLILSRFRHKERQREEIHFLRYFSKIPGLTTFSLSRSDYFEGQGDALFYDGTLLCGYGFRSTREGIAAMVCAIGYAGSRVFLELADERFYHLDTCFCSLGKDILWYPPAFSASAQAMIRNLSGAGRAIAVSEEEALCLACNGIYFEDKNGRALITSPLSRRLRVALEELHIMVFENDVSEFLKAGGGNKCLVFFLN